MQQSFRSCLQRNLHRVQIIPRGICKRISTGRCLICTCETAAVMLPVKRRSWKSKDAESGACCACEGKSIVASQRDERSRCCNSIMRRCVGALLLVTAVGNPSPRLRVESRWNHQAKTMAKLARSLPAKHAGNEKKQCPDDWEQPN